jgi:hypothetical protein
MALRSPTSRPLPQAPMYNNKEGDVKWGEIQDRGIYQPSYQYQSRYQQSNAYHAISPPISPNARCYPAPAISNANPYNSQLQQQHYPFPPSNAVVPSSPSRSPREQQDNITQRPRPTHLNSAPSRFQGNKEAYRPFVYDEEEQSRRTGMANGSAFMHKGFFDIMSLVNSQGVSSPPVRGNIKATFSKATGRFRKTNALPTPNSANEDPFFSSPTPQVVKASPLAPLSSNRIYLRSPLSPSASMATQLGGPRAQKKRISVDMIGSPCIDTFVHAAHASDAEQAEEILKRWSRDGVGKIAGEFDLVDWHIKDAADLKNDRPGLDQSLQGSNESASCS